MVIQGEVKVDQPSGASKQAKQTVEQAQQAAEQAGAHISEATGKLALASIGAVALAGDTLRSWLDKAVARGEEVEEDARKRANKMKEKRQQWMGREKQNLESMMDTTNLSSKSDIQALQDQIAALSAKVDQLNKESAKSSKGPQT